MLAYWDRKDIKEVMGSYLKGKKVKPIPTKKGSKNHAYKNRGIKIFALKEINEQLGVTCYYPQTIY